MEAKVVAQDTEYQLISVPREEWAFFAQFMKLSHLDWRNYIANKPMAIVTDDLVELIKAAEAPMPTETELLQILSRFAYEYNCLSDSTALWEIQWAYEQVMGVKSPRDFNNLEIDDDSD